MSASQRGDTLIEVTMAIAILSVMLVTAFNVASLTVRVGMQARERVQAAHLAQQQAERLIAWRNQLVSTRTFFPVVDKLNCSDGCSIAYNSSTGTYASAAPLTSGPFNVAVRLEEDAAPGSYESFQIDVRWASLVSSEENLTRLNLKLADTSNLNLRDCSVAGSCVASQGAP